MSNLTFGTADDLTALGGIGLFGRKARNQPGS
jgi:hypothetical protein